MSLFKRHDLDSYVQFESSFANVIFGFRSLTQDDLTPRFPKIDFRFVKQIHSNKVVSEGATPWLEADGHWTTKKQQALAIQTADCLPIVLVSPHVAMALHAGWRGLEANICHVGIAQLKQSSVNLREIFAFIGPHISSQNFEVGSDVAERLANAYQKTHFHDGDLLLPHTNREKKYVDLSLLARAQLVQAGIPQQHIFHVNLDTYSDDRFVSYRKTGAGGRQWSFCYLK